MNPPGPNCVRPTSESVANNTSSNGYYHDSKLLMCFISQHNVLFLLIKKGQRSWFDSLIWQTVIIFSRQDAETLKHTGLRQHGQIMKVLNVQLASAVKNYVKNRFFFFMLPLCCFLLPSHVPVCLPGRGLSHRCLCKNGCSLLQKAVDSC